MKDAHSPDLPARHEQPPANNANPPAAKTPRVSSRAVTVVALVVAANLIGLAIFWMVRSRNPLPLLTPAVLQAAVERWEAHGPADYNLDVVLSGSQTGDIHVEVRNGQVTEMTRNGIRPKRRSTWDYWSVDSQLEIIGKELAMADNAEPGSGPRGSRFVQWAEFDAALGYPREYHRIILGSQTEIRWKITHFEALPPQRPNG